MYNYTENQIMMPDEFFLPFGGKLNPQNRWCQLALIIPWAEVEEKYAMSFKSTRFGQLAYPVRVALGSLIIQNKKSLSNRETVEEITENPYLQYFIGLPQFVEELPFNPSLMVHFRKRLGKNIIDQINEMIARPGKTKKKDPDDPPFGDGIQGGGVSVEPIEPGVPENQGKLILDATCAPADIHYPTDLWLLNRVRELLEEIIDVLHEPHMGKSRKPRTYRNCARRDYLNIDKKKRKTSREIRKGVGQQLRYVKRDLAIVRNFVRKSPLTLLSRRQYRNLLVSSEIYRQQLKMYQKRCHQVDDRIVSLHMPFVRPIVRGKAGLQGTQYSP